MSTEAAELGAKGIPPLDGEMKGNDESVVCVDAKEKQFNLIKNLHLAAFIFMGIQAIAYGAAQSNTDLKIIMTVGFTKRCDYQTETCSMWGSKPNMKQLGSWNPIWLMTFFVVLASFDHLCSYLYMRKYAESAKEWLFDIGSNPFRMIEYSISASAMALAISLLSGISDVHIVFLIFFMHAIGMALGLVIELIPVDKYYSLTTQDPSTGEVVPAPSAQKSEDMKNLNDRLMLLRKIVTGIGWVTVFTPWLVMLCYFSANAKRLSDENDDLPNFVYAAFLGTLLLFVLFGVNSYCCSVLKLYKFPKAEMIYIILSFTAKTFLAGDVFGGLNSSDNHD